MKVREVITIKGWINGSGWSYNQTYSDDVINDVDALPEDFADFDREWRNGWRHNDIEDTLITAAYYAIDDAEMESPLAKFSEWASKLSDGDEADE